MHGNQPGLLYSTMGAEVYANRLVGSGRYTPRLMDHRGGQLLLFYNAMDGVPTMPVLRVTDEYDDSISPCNDCVQHPNNAYYWNNTYNSALVAATESTDCCNSISENSEFFNQSGSCTAADCSSGMGCGPTPPSGTCATGVAYWVTEQACEDPEGVAGRHSATPISGTLYKCTSPNWWTPYYRPYPYPHPLRTGAQ